MAGVKALIAPKQKRNSNQVGVEMTRKTSIVSAGTIAESIVLIRGQRVLLDYDLASLYEVPTKTLKQAVRRNIERFPADFMFELTDQELTNLRSQIVTSNVSRWGGRRYRPMAFTQEGVAMLSGVLHSARAVEVNIAVMRAFVRLRQMLSSHENLARKIDALERKYDTQFKVVFDALHALMQSPEERKKKIGFGVKEPASVYATRKKGRKT